jgi:hypothetical protein
MSTGDPAMVTLGSLWPVVSPVPRVPSVSGASQGPTGVEVVGGSPPPPLLGDNTRSLLWGLVVRGTGTRVSGSAALGDAVPAPGSLSAVGPGAYKLYLSGSPSFLPHPSTGGGWGMKQSLFVHRLPS